MGVLLLFKLEGGKTCWAILNIIVLLTVSVVVVCLNAELLVGVDTDISQNLEDEVLACLEYSTVFLFQYHYFLFLEVKKYFLGSRFRELIE